MLIILSSSALESINEGLLAKDAGKDNMHFEQKVVLLHGQGGSGKTECLNILRRISEKFFGTDGHAFMCSSNSAARQVQGDTIHSCLHMGSEQRLHPPALEIDPTLEAGIALIDRWAPVQLLVVDEISMVAPRLLGALSYRLCVARASTHGAQKDFFAIPGDVFGRIPLVVLSGDFMQLPPFEGRARVSLMKDPRKSSDGQDDPNDKSFLARNGYSPLWDCLTYVVCLEKTFRFKDSKTKEPCPLLPRLFSYMRDSRALKDKGPLPPDMWAALQRMVVRGETDERLVAHRRADGYEMAIVWESVARLMQYRALRESRAAGQVLMYVQALDWPRKGKRLKQSEYKQALQVVNMTQAGNRLGMCPLFLGMRVRLTTKLSAKYGIVQDAVGEVIEVIFDEREFETPRSDWRDDEAHPVRRKGYVRLRYLPQGVLVRFDNFKEDFGFGVGVVHVACRASSKWDFHTHDEISGVRTLESVPMTRVNEPLAPEKVRTVQTAQGMSMDNCVMMLDRPYDRMSFDDWWLHVYVMLSRVRTAKGVLLYGLPGKFLFERGPPEFLSHGISALLARAERTKASLDVLVSDLDLRAEAGD